MRGTTLQAAWVCLVVPLLAVAATTLAGCGGEAPEEEDESQRPYAALSLEELVDWEARPSEPSELAGVLVELDRRVGEMEEEALFGTVLPALEPVLAHEAAVVREQAVRVAGTAARRTELEPAVALVAEAAVSDEATQVRLAAVTELGALLQRRVAATELVLDTLARATADRRGLVRKQALSMLAASGSYARGAAGAVLDLAQAGEEIALHERLKAWETLAALKPTDESVREAVEEAAGAAEDERIALHATNVLVALTELEEEEYAIADDALTALLAPLMHDSAEVRLRAIEALEAAGPPADDIAGEALAELAQHDPQDEVRRRAAQARQALGLDEHEGNRQD